MPSPKGQKVPSCMNRRIQMAAGITVPTWSKVESPGMSDMLGKKEVRHGGSHWVPSTEAKVTASHWIVWLL